MASTNGWIQGLTPGWSQAKQRGQREFFDQHGRRWFANYEHKTNHPCGPILPMFDAPFLPDSQYFRYPRLRPNDLVIDYDQIVKDLTARHEEYQALVLKAGVHFLGQNFNPNAPPTAQILADVGPAPYPLEPVLAAKAENGYVLGKREYDPKRSGDRKIKAALDAFHAPRTSLVSLDPSVFADDFADEPAQESAEPVKRKPGRPKKVVGVSEEVA